MSPQGPVAETKSYVGMDHVSSETYAIAFRNLEGAIFCSSTLNLNGKPIGNTFQGIEAVHHFLNNHVHPDHAQRMVVVRLVGEARVCTQK